MKAKLFCAAALALALLPQPHALAQGPLTPPGAPTPTMKKLDQVEPRRPIAAVPFTITESGSYYLTGNITGRANEPGIVVNADNVTIDLNGFALIGISNSTDGISTSNFLEKRTNIAVRNGVIRNWNQGIVFLNLTSGHFEKLSVTNNFGTGVNIAASGLAGTAVVRDCVFAENTQAGLSGSTLSVSGCTARANGNSGFDVDVSTVQGCTAVRNHVEGIFASDGSSVSECVATENDGNGINVSHGTVSRSIATRNLRNGIVSTGSSVILNNTCDENGTSGAQQPTAGIVASNSGSRIESNNLSNNKNIGIRVTNGGNIIIKNSSRGGSDAYDIAAGNSMGQEISVSDPNATTVINTSNSWANFLY